MSQTNNSSKNMIVKLKTYRYKFTNEFINELYIFSKIHQYDDRKTFKEAWNNWIIEDEIERLIQCELLRLEEIEYKGDIMIKMFQSARYYYRKKIEIIKNIKKPIEKKQKEFPGFSPNLLEAIDIHVVSQIKDNIEIGAVFPKTIIKSAISPANAYLDFCNRHIGVITSEIELIQKKVTLDVGQNEPHQTPSPALCSLNIYRKEEAKQLSMKFKKTYKNRFYNIKTELEHN